MRTVAFLCVAVALIATAEARYGMKFSCGGQWENLDASYGDYCEKLCDYCERSNPGDDEPKFDCMTSHGRDYCVLKYDCGVWTAEEGSVPSMKSFCVNEACGNYCKYDSAVDLCMREHYGGFCKKVGTGTPTAAPTTTKKQDNVVGACYAMSGWDSDAACKICPGAATGGCEAFGHTACSSTMEECIQKAGGGTTCWAPTSWSGAKCEICTKVSGQQCSGFGWTKCYKSKDDCEKNDEAIGDNSANTGCKELDKKQCPSDTSKLQRPKFKGPNCYDSKYGSQFGPNWKPSGKTTFEKYIKGATELYKVIYTNAQMPQLSDWNGAVGCDGATAVFENFVCALELIESNGRQFAGPRAGAAGSSVREFAGSSDDQVNRREIAAFFSHKFKETGSLTAWDEQNNNPSAYLDVNSPYTPGKSYHGRGPVQISWNYNYGDFSKWYFNNNKVLLDDPDMVDPQGPMGFIAALWFWFTPRDFSSNAPIAGSIRTRDAIVHWQDGQMNTMYGDGKDYDSYSGLSLSTNVINGGIECAGGGDSAKYRIEYFLNVAAKLGVQLPSKEMFKDKQSCMADKFCRGLYAGCSSVAGGLTCEPKETPCGTNFIQGWSGRMCSF